jgi:hypothetical protein
MKLKWVRGVLIFLGCVISCSTVRPDASTSSAVNERPSYGSTGSPRTATYICGDLFRATADFVVDGYKLSFNPKNIRSGDVVFVQGNLLDFFFAQVHSTIDCCYILVTHNSDFPAPGPYATHLDDETIIAWFGQHGDLRDHPKFFHIPTGIPNSCWPFINGSVIDTVRTDEAFADRFMLLQRLDDGHSCRSMVQGKKYQEHIESLAAARFVVCPSTQGLDNHCVWEALLVGAVPIVYHSMHDSVFAGLPVIFIDDVGSVTEQFLHDEHERIRKELFFYERLFADYWLDKIVAVRAVAKSLLT